MYIENLCMRVAELESQKHNMLAALSFLRDCYQFGNTIMTCGNGESAADS